jgi:hypothetical protein
MIYIFANRGNQEENWHFMGEANDDEEAKEIMTQTGEPEVLKYWAIEGETLDTQEGQAIYPTEILRRKKGISPRGSKK